MKNGLIINLDTTPRENQISEFNSRIFPYFTTNGTVDGFTISGGWADSAWKSFDGDKSTAGSAFSSRTLIMQCPIFINPKTIYIYGKEDVSNDATMNIYGVKKDGIEILLYTTTWAGTFDQTITLDTDEYFCDFHFATSPNYSSTSSDLMEISIESGYKSNLKTNITNYINVNGLGNKLIVGTIDINKKYELVYDGTVFNAREVV